jgi:long-chain fatty acid transport protein
MKLKKIAALLAVAGMSAPAFATNGMNMEGYGPIATGMGGAAMAFDHGTAGMMNNPATLGLMASGTSRLDIAVGGLHPDVNTKTAGQPTAGSDGDAYYMPAIGYVRKDGKLAWGAGMMAQGGMGTEYGKNSFLSSYDATFFGINPGGATGAENRSELGIGRLIFPLSYEVSDTLQVGGSVDYLWGGLDIQMVMSGAMFGRFATPGGSILGSASGSMVNALPNFIDATTGMPGAVCAGPAPACIQDINWAQFDFSEGSNKMKQELKTDGWAGNIGFVWKAAPNLSIGGVYHAKTSLKDMKGDGTMNMNVDMNVPAGGATGGPGYMTVGITGKLKVIDFQWPETYGIGIAYQANDRLLLAVDYKRINWADVMKNFRMSFTADAVQANPMAQQMVTAGATQMNVNLVQKWDDQNVFMIGGAYKYTDALTLRAGVNLANNPVPKKYMNPLFPATIEDTLTLGFGYAFDKVSSVDFSYTYAPEVSVTNTNWGVKTTHGQSNNWQAMYSHRF